MEVCWQYGYVFKVKALTHAALAFEKNKNISSATDLENVVWPTPEEVERD